MSTTLPAILAIDQGTTGSTAVIYNPHNWSIYGRATLEFPQLFPKPSYVEHDPEEIWKSVVNAIQKALKEATEKCGAGKKICIESIGVTNQRETVICFDRKSGKPLSNAIVWQDRRTAEMCRQIREDRKFCERMQNVTGLVADPYFSGTKISWMLHNIPELKSKVDSGSAVFGTIDSFLVHRLTGGKSFVTDATNASRTMLTSLEHTQYDDELLLYFGIPLKSLPEILPSLGSFGVTLGLAGIEDGTPIESILGDQQAALYGQNALLPGEAKVTFGTGAFLLMNTGPKIVHSKQGLLTSVAFKTSTQTVYCLEGSCFIAGAAIQFLRDSLNFFANSKDSEQLALSEESDPHVEFVPSLAGLGAPFWNPDAKGVLFGLSRGTSKSQITRAVLESIALQNVPLLASMENESGLKLKWLGVDGGAAANNYLMQFQADVLQTSLRRPANVEATSLGAAKAAAHFKNKFEIKSENQEAKDQGLKVFAPKMESARAQKRFQHWLKAAQAVNSFYSSMM